jgi:hypothetical protein
MIGNEASFFFLFIQVCVGRIGRKTSSSLMKFSGQLFLRIPVGTKKKINTYINSNYFTVYFYATHKSKTSLGALYYTVLIVTSQTYVNFT